MTRQAALSRRLEQVFRDEWGRVLATLIGFLGNDAITRTANNASFTVLSLATKSSYKLTSKDLGKRISVRIKVSASRW